MSASLLASLFLALTWTTNLSTHLIHHSGKHAPANPATGENGDNGNNGDGSEHSNGSSEGATASQIQQMKRMMAAEEASLRGGFFERVINFYEVWLRRALEHPLILGVFCVVLIGVSYVCYNQLGSDLLPHMDEGGFILDYVTPPGSSLQETNRMVSHIEQIVRTVPEVEKHIAAHGVAVRSGRRDRSKHRRHFGKAEGRP